jgi:predicted DCC family thiol-disulfide oxidoreductase YuxK
MVVPALTRPSWNPFRCGGTALPVPLLLMAKLIALAFLLTNHVRLLPDPFLPFLPFLDQLVPGPVFQRTLQAVFLISAAALLFNRRVRTCCLLLGGTVLLSVLASRAYYGNNKTFCALMLILAGLYTGGEPRLLRWQVALVYFGAGLNKALDPDWHSGQFFEHWARVRLEQPVYIWLSSMLPPLVLGKLMCWMTIVLEWSAAALLTIPRTRLYGVCISILLQSGFLLFTGQTFTMFFFGMQAAMFAFLPWPQKNLEVIYDGDCGFCDWCREQISRFDLEQVFTWVPYQTGRGRAFGIRDDQASARLQLITPSGKVLDGFLAVRRMLLYLPAFWLIVCALIALAPAPVAPTWRRVIVAAVLLLFTPIANGPGIAAYDFVARHRHRIFPGRACRLPDPPASQ